MSMENAILEHAAALRELSAAIKAMYAGRADALALPPDVDAETANHQRDFGADEKTSPAREADQSALDKAKAGTKKEKDADLENAVAKVEDGAKKPAPTAGTATDPAGSTEIQTSADAGAPTAPGDAEAAPINYEKDVRPLLLAAIKKGKRGEIEAFLAAEGVKKADELPAEKLPALFDLAQKLAA